MIRNFIITAWRNLKTNKAFSFINIFGLSVGLACCMLISAYLYQELTYDTYSPNAKQLYRVYLSDNSGGLATEYPAVDMAVGPGIKNAFPGVKAFTRLTRRGPAFVKYGDRSFKEEKIMLIDSNFLQLFSIPMLQGDSKNALTEPKTIVITKDFEKNILAMLMPLGK